MQTVPPPVITPNTAATTQLNLLTTQAVPTLTQLPVAIASLAQGDSAIVNGVTVSRQGDTLVLQDADGSIQQVSGFFSGHLDEVERLARLRAALEGNDGYKHVDADLVSANVVPADYLEVAGFGEPIQLAQAGNAPPPASSGPVFASGASIAPVAGLGLASAAVIAPASLALAAAAAGGGGGGDAPASATAEEIAAANSKAALEQVATDGASLTATQLSAIQGLTDVDAAHLDAYKAYIAANSDTFTDGATVEEVQAMVTAVNSVAVNIEGVIGQFQGGLQDGATTTDATPTVRVSFAQGIQAGDTVQLYDGNDVVGTRIAVTDDHVIQGYVDIATPELGDGTYNFRAEALNSQGLQGPKSADGAFDIAINTADQAVASVLMSDVVGNTGGFVIRRAWGGDRAGFSVKLAGDVNGDGYDDVVVGASGASSGKGRIYVVFGGGDLTTVNLRTLEESGGGFVINGVADKDNLGVSVSAAGDFNGDGKDDLLVGASLADFGSGKKNAGAAYIVWGKDDTSAVSLSEVETGSAEGIAQGMALKGSSGGILLGYAVSAAGDVNGDGYADVIAGAYQRGTKAGASYVLFGSADPSNASTSGLESGSPKGIVINAESNYDSSGFAVSAAGDVNGDGFADLLVGSPNVNGGEGRTYVVFGQANMSDVRLSDVKSGVGGFAVTGNNALGTTLSAAGDVNGDGLADFVVGGKPGSSTSYVVFGKTDTSAVSTSAIANGAAGGFAIQGDNGEYTVSGAGDINGDGLSDLIVGVTDKPGYVVFGKTDSDVVSLSDVASGDGGFALLPLDGDTGKFGAAVSAGGDINGDGLADLIVSARTAESGGHTYVIFGSTTGAFADTAVDQMGTRGDDTLTANAIGQTLVGDAGNDTLIAKDESVLYGGTGDDTMVVDAGMVAGLQHTGVSTVQARVDGGGGIDTLKLTGDLALDLTAVPNQAGGSNPAGGSRIDSVEVVDLVAGEGANKLTIAAHDVFDMSSFNVFEATGRAQLLVKGDAADTLDLNGDAWSRSGTQTFDGAVYNVLENNSTLATIYVEQGIYVM